MTRYNGWLNYETWNVALWIANDEHLLAEAKRFKHRGYVDFARYMADQGKEMSSQGASPCLLFYQTPDNISWNDSGLDIDALDNMIKEL